MCIPGDAGRPIIFVSRERNPRGGFCRTTRERLVRSTRDDDHGVVTGLRRTFSVRETRAGFAFRLAMARNTGRSDAEPTSRRRFIAELSRRGAKSRLSKQSAERNQSAQPLVATAPSALGRAASVRSIRSKGSGYRSRRAKALNSRARRSCGDYLRSIALLIFLLSYLKHASTCRDDTPVCYRRQRRCRTPIRQSGDDLSPMAARSVEKGGLAISCDSTQQAGV